MKKIIFSALILSSLLFMGSEPVYYEYVPVFMSRDAMEKAVKVLPPKPVKDPGKIYFKDPYIFINEKYRGFHVIDNHDPSAPENVAFIHVDGCLDIAIRDNLIYADNAVDLIVLQIDTWENTSVVGRVRNTLPEPSSPDGPWMKYSFEKYRPKNAILVRWEKSK